MWKERLLSALLAAALGAAALGLVVRFAPPAPHYTPEQMENGLAYAASGVRADETVLTLDGNGASTEMMVFWIGSECAALEAQLGESGLAARWDELRDRVREAAKEDVCQQLLLENLCARFGVTLSEADEAELAAQREQFVAYYGTEDNYRAELYRLGISEAGYERLARSDCLFRALYRYYLTPGSDLYASDDVLHAYAAGEGYVTADHILISTVDQATRAPLDDATVAEKRALAEDLLARLRASDDMPALFAELADAYSEDPGREAYPEGYTFTHGTMVAEFDEAAHALREGELSGLVETQYGYHIILRRPLDVAEAAEAVRDDYFSAFFYGEFERAEPETTPAFDRLDPAAVYEALRAAQAETVG